MDNNEKERSSSNRQTNTININNNNQRNSNKTTELDSNSENNSFLLGELEVGEDDEEEDEEEDDDDDDEDDDEDDSQQNELNLNNAKLVDDLEFEFTKSQNEISIDEDEVINESDLSNTNKYLNLLGEDLLMEEKDILISKKKTPNKSKHSKQKSNQIKTESNEIKNDAAINDSYTNQFARGVLTNNNNIDKLVNESLFDMNEKELDLNEFFSNKLDTFTKSDLIKIIENLHRENFADREENEKMRVKYNALCVENRKLLSLLEQMHFERNEIVKEYNKLKVVRAKEAKRAKCELEAVSREYTQIMSERDSVHKEMEALQEQLSKSQDRLKKYARESMSFTSNVGGCGGGGGGNNNNNNVELNSTHYGTMTTMSNTITENLNELAALNEMQNRQNKVNSGVFGLNMMMMNGMGSMDEALEIDSLKYQLSIVTKQRDEAIIQIRELCHQIRNSNNNSKYNESDYIDRLLIDKTNNSSKPDEENDKLRYQLKDMMKELEIARKKRDMAFNERDKMIKERESIRALCDELRHQRDKAISELAEALHETDELKKQNLLAFRQIQMLEENINLLEEKLAYLRELQELNEEEDRKKAEKLKNREKRVTAKKETDSSEWRTLKVEIDLNESAELGIELDYSSNLRFESRPESRVEPTTETDEKTKLNSSPNTSEISTTKKQQQNSPLNNNNLPIDGRQNKFEIKMMNDLKDDDENTENGVNGHSEIDINISMNTQDENGDEEGEEEEDDEDEDDSSTEENESEDDDDDESESEEECEHVKNNNKNQEAEEEDVELKNLNEEDANEEVTEELMFIQNKTDATNSDVRLINKNLVDDAILISQIDENGLAYGKLKVFDRVLKINDINVQSMKISAIKEMISNLRGTVSFVVTRHFPQKADDDSSSRNLSNDKLRKENDAEAEEESSLNDEDEEIISSSLSLSTTTESSTTKTLNLKFSQLNDSTTVNIQQQQQQQQINNNENHLPQSSTLKHHYNHHLFQSHNQKKTTTNNSNDSSLQIKEATKKRSSTIKTIKTIKNQISI